MNKQKIAKKVQQFKNLTEHMQPFPMTSHPNSLAEDFEKSMKDKYPALTISKEIRCSICNDWFTLPANEDTICPCCYEDIAQPNQSQSR